MCIPLTVAIPEPEPLRLIDKLRTEQLLTGVVVLGFQKVNMPSEVVADVRPLSNVVAPGPSPKIAVPLYLTVMSVVILYVPRGKYTIPPAVAALNAAWIAVVSSVVPSPVA